MTRYGGTGLRILGMDVLTDHPPLAHLLNLQFNTVDGRESLVGFETAFPGFVKAVIDGHKELANQRLQATLVTYFNFRVQVWALGFDADPSTMKRCLPADTIDEAAYKGSVADVISKHGDTVKR
jgi:hypothetical protein